jgi:hypothetical protein
MDVREDDALFSCATIDPEASMASMKTKMLTFK